MKILCICPDSFAANTYLLVGERSAIVVDPAVTVEAIKRQLDANNVKLVGIILTHGHFDHTMSVDTLRHNFDVPLMIHKADAQMLTNGKINGFYEFYGQECVHKAAQILLDDGDTIDLDNESIRILSTPGHSPGSICLLCPDGTSNGFIVTGDTLFSNTIGRCDLWGGDEGLMVNSLKRLKELPGDMTIYPGHGPEHVLDKALETALYYTDF